jgi:hypothetical protein
MSDRDTKAAAAPEDDAGFLQRWSRRKHSVAAGSVPPEPAAPVPAPVVDAPPAPPLPDPAALDFNADFSAYLHARVPAALKRQAMQRLFADPVFNQMDGLDIYIEDYNLIPDLPAAEAALLQHAREVLFPTDGKPLLDETGLPAYATQPVETAEAPPPAIVTESTQEPARPPAAEADAAASPAADTLGSPGRP